MRNKDVMLCLVKSTVGGYFTTVVRQDGSGLVDVFYQAVSSHPWKDRSYQRKRLGAIYKYEYDLVCAIAQAKSEADAAKRENKRQKELARDEWINSLPTQVGDFYVDKAQEAIVDDVGNYYWSLPQEPVVDIAAWCQKQLNTWGYPE